MAPALVDKLTANGAMHLLFRIRDTTNTDGGPVLTEAVKENSILQGRSSQIDNGPFGRLQRASAPIVNSLSRCIPNRHLNITERLARIRSQVIDEVGLPA